MTEPPVVVEAVSHSYGTGTLRRQVLHAVSAQILAGEIVILTGPSGSGKTTLLTLMGALRATQTGSLRVLGHELRAADEAALVSVRRQIGFIFQFHNLVAALSAVDNVAMGLPRHLGLSRRVATERAYAMLASVGLRDRARCHPHQLSGGEKQRVAVARALAGRPRIVLADEPTGSLDRESGRDVVDRLHDLARRDGAAVVLVTHDNRILDVADRIIHLEEGRLSPFSEAVRASTQQLLATLTRSTHRAEVLAEVAAMPPGRFVTFLGDLTHEARHVLDALTLATTDAFEVLLAQMLEVCTLKVGQLLDADRVSLFLADEPRAELYSLVAQGDGQKPLAIRLPASTGVAGHVYRTGAPLNVPDAYAHPLFNPAVDRETGYRTRSILCVPVAAAAARPFAVMTLLNKKGQPAFDDGDERAAIDLAAHLGIVLQTWHQAYRTRAADRGG